MKTLLGVLGFVIFISLVVWWEYSVWDECLSKNSIMYCMRTLG